MSSTTTNQSNTTTSSSSTSSTNTTNSNNGVNNSNNTNNSTNSSCNSNSSSSNAILSSCIPKLWFSVFNFILIALIALIFIHAGKEFTSIENDEDPEVKIEKMRILGAASGMIGILAWPIIWNALVGYNVITHHPLTLFGFLWPMVMNILDLSAISTSKNAVQAEKVFGIGQITSDSNTLVGIAFSIGSLLSSQGNQKLANATIPLFMYSLLLLIAFIIPTPSLDPNDYAGFTLGTVQRTFFNYAMGFVITGITVNVTSGGGMDLQHALANLCK